MADETQADVQKCRQFTDSELRLLYDAVGTEFDFVATLSAVRYKAKTEALANLAQKIHAMLEATIETPDRA